MELIQLLNYVLMTEQVNPSGGNELWFLLEFAILCAEPLHQLWNVLKRRAFVEKAFAVVLFGAPVFIIMLLQTIFMEGFFSYKQFLQYRETREIMAHASFYQEMIRINIVTMLLIVLCFVVTVKQNGKRGKGKVLCFLSIGGLEFVLAILMIGFSYYILTQNPWFFFEQEPEIGLVYLYMGWHMVLKSIMLLGILLFSAIFYRKEQGTYQNEMDARGYLEKHISQQGRFMTFASGIFLLMLCPGDWILVNTIFTEFPAGEEVGEWVLYIISILIISVLLLGMTVAVFGVFCINIKRWLKPESDIVFKSMDKWGNKSYIIQTLCAERYKSEERIFKSRGYEVTENFIYRPNLFWKYDLFYLKQIKSVTQAVGMDGVCTVLTFQDGKKFKAYHMQAHVLKHIKSFLPAEGKQ
jgi:hypothetical protein